MGMLLALLGAGAVVAERRLVAGKTTRLRLGVVIGDPAAVAAAITLPLVPVGDLHATPTPAINEDAIETVGWPALTATVASVWQPTPASPSAPTRSCSRATTARRVRSPASALRSAFAAPTRATTRSGASAVPRTAPARSSWSAITASEPSRIASPAAGASAARIDNGVALDNEEQGGPVWLCAAPSSPGRRSCFGSPPRPVTGDFGQDVDMNASRAGNGPPASELITQRIAELRDWRGDTSPGCASSSRRPIRTSSRSGSGRALPVGARRHHLHGRATEGREAHVRQGRVAEGSDRSSTRASTATSAAHRHP